MEKKTPISLEAAAIHLLVDHEQAARKAGRKGTDPGHLFWYAYNFVDWISRNWAVHIDLAGDEFEPVSMSDKVC